MRQASVTPENLGLTVLVDPRRSDLVVEFFESCRADVLTLRTAMVMADFATIEGLGHRMRGAGDSIEFDFISDVGDQVEAAAQQRDESVIREQINTLQNFLDHVDVIVN